MLISLPKISEGGFIQANIVLQALAHLLEPSIPSRMAEQNNLLRLAFLFLEIAADENIEKLIRAAEFHVGFHHDGVPALHDWILNLVRVDRLGLIDPITKIFALKHLLQRHHAVQADDLFELHGFEPFAVRDELRASGVEHLERLFTIRFGVGQDLLAAELGAGGGAAAGVADHRSKIADNQNCFVTEILKLPQLPENQRVAQMKIRTRGIDPQFDAERPAEGEFLAELGLADNLGAALLEKGKSFVRLHGSMQRPELLFVFVQQFSHLLDREWLVPRA